VALAIATIGITLGSILKKHHETLAFGYAGVQMMESVIFIVVAVLGILLILTVSQEVVKAGSLDALYFQTLGRLLQSAHDWSYVLAGKIIFTLSALMLNYILYRSELVPRFISIWGLLGAARLLVGGLLNLFGSLPDRSIPGTLVFLPIALQEMIFAVWLIAKGFNPSGLTAETVNEF